MRKCNKERSNQAIAIAKTIKMKNEEKDSQKHIRIQNGDSFLSFWMFVTVWKWVRFK